MEKIKKLLIEEKIKKIFSSDFTGHDFEHTKRVYNNALMISQEIACNQEIIMLASLLHDVDDAKIFNTLNNQNARQIMKELNIDDKIVEEVIQIINKISFKGTGKDVPDSIEGKIVQDADRLDALGAIGIARAFAYGAVKKRKMYDEKILPNCNLTEENYHREDGTTVNHFYEKLFLLKDLMNTTIAKQIAIERTKIMEAFLEEFVKEWNA